MNILLIWLQMGSYQKPGVHHGLASIAGYLKSGGHTIECQTIFNDVDLDKVVSSITLSSTHCIGISLTSNQRRYLNPCVKAIRARYKGIIIAGGVHATLDPEDVLSCPDIDGVCIGDGERPLGILADHIEQQTPYWDIPSFFWNKVNNGKREIVRNQLHPLGTDLSGLPEPDYSIFDIVKINSQLGGIASVILSRGCTYDCSYCCNRAIKSVVSGDKQYFRRLSVDNALCLLENYKTLYHGVKGFAFEDDLLLINKKWFRQFTLEYKERIGLPYICNGRFELMQNEETIKLLKESGCKMVNLGLESGDEHFRKSVLNRTYSNNDIYNTVQLLKKYDLPFFTYNIFGFPFETKEQMQKTIDINREIRPNSGQTFFFYPYPKTELYNICFQNNLLKHQDMEEVSGYKEKPVIKLTNCTESDCMNAYNQLTLFLISRKISKFFGYNSSLIDKVISGTLMLYPSLFVKLLTKKNPIKQFSRKVFYKKLSYSKT